MPAEILTVVCSQKYNFISVLGCISAQMVLNAKGFSATDDRAEATANILCRNFYIYELVPG